MRMMADVGRMMGEALARAQDRILARIVLTLGWYGQAGVVRPRTYLRHRRLFGVNMKGEKVRYDDESGKWVLR
jgi:hypothetical protein